MWQNSMKYNETQEAEKDTQKKGGKEQEEKNAKDDMDEDKDDKDDM